MLIGLDLQHGSVPGIGRTSTVGVVGSTYNYTDYVSACDIQSYKDDIVQNMGTVIENLMKNREERFAQCNPPKRMIPPQTIYYFRDGTDFGQQEDVGKREVRIIEDYFQRTFKFRPV